MKTLASIDHAYGTNIIFDGADIELPDRGVVALRGPNGCGKTTLLKLLGGILPTTSKEILRWRENQTAVYLDVEFLTLDYLTVQEQLGMVAPLTGHQEIPRDDENSLLTASMLSTKVGDLSLGQRQRLVLTVALSLQGVDVLLLDEPLNGLDWQASVLAREWIRRSGEDRLVLLATHEDDRWTDYDLVVHHNDAVQLNQIEARI